MNETGVTDIAHYKIKQIPLSVYYVPDFITCAEEEFLTRQVYSAPKPRWTQLTNRRLQNWGGLPHPKGMVAEDLPQWLQIYSKKIADLGVFDDKVPNHVLVNEYKPGQGIMPHEDGPLYYPTVSTISLGSHSILNFYRPIVEASDTATDTCDTEPKAYPSTSLDDRYMCSILIQPRSLVLVRDDMYKVNLHGIDEKVTDCITDSIVNLDKCSGISVGDVLQRSTRISLTIRYVPKILKAKLFLGRRR